MVNGPDPAVGFGGVNLLLVACNQFNYDLKLQQVYPGNFSIFRFNWVHFNATYLHL